MPKKLLIWFAIGCAAFYLVTEPSRAAGSVRGVAGGIGDAFGSVITFISTLFA